MAASRAKERERVAVMFVSSLESAKAVKMGGIVEEYAGPAVCCDIVRSARSGQVADGSLPWTPRFGSKRGAGI